MADCIAVGLLARLPNWRFRPKRIARRLPSRPVHIAVTVPLVRLAADHAEAWLAVQLDVAASTDTLQVARHIVLMVAIAVVNVERVRLPAPLAWPRRLPVPRHRVR